MSKRKNNKADRPDFKEAWNSIQNNAAEENRMILDRFSALSPIMKTVAVITVLAVAAACWTGALALTRSSKSSPAAQEQQQAPAEKTLAEKAAEAGVAVPQSPAPAAEQEMARQYPEQELSSHVITDEDANLCNSLAVEGAKTFVSRDADRDEELKNHFAKMIMKSEQVTEIPVDFINPAQPTQGFVEKKEGTQFKYLYCVVFTTDSKVAWTVELQPFSDESIKKKNYYNINNWVCTDIKSENGIIKSYSQKTW